MQWDYVAYFFGGAFLANAIPHIVNGISGRPFQTPFARPSGKGLSSSTVNVLWGALNILVGYLLLARVGVFEIDDCMDAGAVGLGALVMAVVSAWLFGKLHGGNLKNQ